MKEIDLTKTGGFPIKQKTFDHLQLAHFEILAAMIGHFGLPNIGNFIISGCKIVGANITPGFMFIDGKLCPFAGGIGTIATKIGKVTTTEDAAFKNGSNIPVYITVIAAEYATGVALSDFERVPNVQEMVNQAVNYSDLVGIPAGLVIDPAVGATPIQPTLFDRLTKLEQMVAPISNKGVLLLWNKPASVPLPIGWQECVDFRGRMPIGLDTRLLNNSLINPEFSQIGLSNIYSKTVKLEIENIPAHDHDICSDAINLAGASDPYVNTQIADPGAAVINKTSKEGGNPDGTTEPFSIMNPFRVIMFIEYIG